MIDGFILDVTPDPTKAQMVLWIKTPEGRVVPWRAPFTPAFYVAGPQPALDELTTTLPLLPGVGALSFEVRRLGLGGRRRVLKVPVRDTKRLMAVAKMVDARGGHRDLDLYDVDLRASQRFFFDRGLFPFARVRAGAQDDITALDKAWDLEYVRPPLSEASLRVEARRRGARVEPEDPVTRVVLGPGAGSFDKEGELVPHPDDVALEGDEEDVLRETMRLVRERDPDVLYTWGGDRWGLRHLAARAQALGLAGWTLARGEGEVAQPPTRKARSFFQYGHIRYSAPTYPLAGRMHVDLRESFFFGESRLAGVIDLSRLSGIPVSELARLEAGTAVTAIEIDFAKRQGRLIPWKKNMPEKPKTLRSLVRADRGGYIFDPRVGLYDDVIELDFGSLYPALIANHNLGSEAILCACCDPEKLPPERFVPQIGYHVCDKPAVVPQVLKSLVKRRMDIKKMRNAATDEALFHEYKGRVDALKWLNVVAFGYQGYKNARFGCIEAHEATCAWSREALLRAKEIAHDAGYEFLHGIVDSLWLQKVGTASCSAEQLAARVEAEVGIPFEPQGRYKWIVFLPTRSHDAQGAPRIGAPNRFYGCFDKAPRVLGRSQAGQPLDDIAGGAMKVRGVEYRQDSCPPVLAWMQHDMLEVLAKADDAPQFRARIPEALETARGFARRVRAGACGPEELWIDLRVTRGLEGRTQMNHGHAALRQLAAQGEVVAPGDRVRFVITDAASRDPAQRVREKRLGPPDHYDIEAYETLLARGVASLLLPFGYDEAKALAALRGEPMQTCLA
ncbi:MAG: polymerase [Thermoplasmata archaeon]|jgi:DNA polymerase elongation subunit (family B)|nr:polymerase [Thermoplasmata archaeon]